MNLFDLVLLLIIGMVAFQFWRIRAITEQANGYLHQYCEQRQLQLISVARVKTRLSVHRGKLDWYNRFVFEFSGNGEDAYQGELDMAGLRVVDTRLPAYRV